jgi:(1->4)-alpha-D-glucan 1-alpha-D-glucosylmutase
MLKELRDSEDLQTLARSLTDTLEDGRAKLFLTWRALTVRREHPGLFTDGEYLPLDFVGPQAGRLFGFMRRRNGISAMVVVPRFSILNNTETRVVFPDPEQNGAWHNVFTDQRMAPVNAGFPVSELFALFPVALLLREYQ